MRRFVGESRYRKAHVDRASDEAMEGMTEPADSRDGVGEYRCMLHDSGISFFACIDQIEGKPEPSLE